MAQPPPPSEIKKSNRLIGVAIVMLLIGVAVGVAIGWSIGQSRSQAVQSEYTRVKVLTDDVARVTLGGYNYSFFYKWDGYYDQQNPIEVDVSGSGTHYNLPLTQGKSYDVLGIEIIVSEVYDDYIILLAKAL